MDPDSSCDPDLGDLESMTSLVAGRIPGDRLANPLALTFLLRRYAQRGADDAHDNAENVELGETLGVALAIALKSHREGTLTERCAEWLLVFTDACAVSLDDRLHAVACDLVHHFQRSWPDVQYVDQAAMSLLACLQAAEKVATVPDNLMPTVIDELERVVGAAYRPGVGMSHRITRSGLPESDRGGIGDQVHMASALLVAYDKCGRLPYAMLADELVQVARKEIPSDSLILDCSVVQVLCRLAAHYENSGYLHDAVTLTDVNYRSEASQLLHSHTAQMRHECQAPDDALALERIAAYGLALMALVYR